VKRLTTAGDLVCFFDFKQTQTMSQVNTMIEAATLGKATQANAIAKTQNYE